MEKTLRKTLIYRFLKKERFETLLKKIEWRKCSGKKRRDKFEKKIRNAYKKDGKEKTKF